jgi:F0F1-type ATP synthase membrane subunit b/b'
MTGFHLDEKGFIALAFFVCIGFIIKFFGKKITNALEAKRRCINSDLDLIQEKFLNSEKEYESSLKEQENLKYFADNLVKNSENDRISSLESYKKELEGVSERRILKQEKINEQKYSELQNVFDEISLKSSIDLLKDQLIGEQNFGTEKNKKAHKEIIDKFLKITS